MKTVVAVEDFATVRKRSLERARRLDKGAPLEAERRISFERPEDMASFLTSRRLGVLRAAMERPRSVTDLAIALKRIRPAVFRDVRALKQAGLIELNPRPNPGHGQMQIVTAAATKFDFRFQLSG
jgi:predicted transcriptional regulator